MFNVKDQVVIRERTSRSGPVTNQIRVGTVMAVGESALTVSFPLPGGRFTKKAFPISQCEPVTEVFRRNSVQINPLFRQIYKGSV
jgi:hypothetical protein